MKTNNTQGIENINSQYTFWKLLSEYKIEIPIIQRDYAQGRDSAKAIRKELLDNIYTALTDEISLDFDFVYGTSEECVEKNGDKYLKLFPLDGQQRLTTFFLLHWYIAEKEEHMDVARDILSNFTYTTRISSREFCEMIVGLDYLPSSGQSVSEYIKNENLYFKSWDTDPTIKAMLVMLDDIHEKFYDCGPLFEKLISSPALISFNYLPMEHYALTDDLYIKMNARGKALSNFENFKAKFIQHMKKNCLPYKHFEDCIDGQWVELLWDYRSKDNTIDKSFMNLFLYCTEMIFLLTEKNPNHDSPFKDGDIRTLVNYYDSAEKVNQFYSLIDLWKSKKQAKNYLESILSKDRVKGKVRLFDGHPDIFSDVILDNNVSITNKILLFSIMKRLILLGKDTDRDMMLDYVRIVRNLLIQVRAFKSAECAFTSDFRFGRNGIPNVTFIVHYLAKCECPYSSISGKYLNKYEINSEIYRHESTKANTIISKPELKGLIQGLEDLSIFRGSIFNILDYAIEYEDESLITELEKLFIQQNSDDIITALLSVGNYGIKVGSTYLGDRYFFGDKSEWYEILTYPGGSDFKNIISGFIRQYQNNENEYIGDALQDIATENLKNIKISDWRYCLVKYPSTIKEAYGITYSKLVFAFEHDYITDFFRLHRMNGKTLNAHHVVPEYIEVANQLKGKCSTNIAGLNTDDLGGIILIDSSNRFLSVVLNEQGDPELKYNDIDQSLIDHIISEYNHKNTPQLDYVECLVSLAQTAIETLSKKR